MLSWNGAEVQGHHHSYLHWKARKIHAWCMLLSLLKTLERFPVKHASINVWVLARKHMGLEPLSQFSNICLAFVSYLLNKFLQVFVPVSWNWYFHSWILTKCSNFVSQCVRGTGRLAHLPIIQQCKQTP
jgi:hypothetical protein